MKGPLSPALCLFTSPVTLLLSSCGSVLPKTLLRGTLSPSIGDLTGLEHIDLSHNDIRGNLPASLGQLYKAQTIQLQFNAFSGTVPDSLGNLVACTSLYLQHNQLRGFIPQSLSIIPDLRYCTLLPWVHRCAEYSSVIRTVLNE